MTTLPTSGAISLGNVRSAFVSSNNQDPIFFDMLYNRSGNVTFNTDGIPQSGAISLSDFYGKTKPVQAIRSLNTSQSWTTFYLNTSNTLRGTGDNIGTMFGAATVSSLTDISLPANSGTAVSLSSTSTMNGVLHVLTSLNKVVAIGSNNFMQIGDNTTTNRNTFVEITASGSLNGRTVTNLASSVWGTTIALDSTGQIHVWGNDQAGSFTANTYLIDTASMLPINYSTRTGSSNIASKTIAAISSGAGHAAITDSTGALYTWGTNQYGKLALSNNVVDGSFLLRYPAGPITQGSLSGVKVISVSCGTHHTLALDSTGAVHAWGDNRSGQIGNGTTSTGNNGVIIPVKTSLYGALVNKRVVQISAGNSHNLALDENNNVYAWGHNLYGQVNQTTGTNPNTPQNITTYGSLSGKKIVYVQSFNHACTAVDSSNNLYTWGHNLYGQLGTATNNGTNTASGPPALRSSGIKPWFT